MKSTEIYQRSNMYALLNRYLELQSLQLENLLTRACVIIIYRLYSKILSILTENNTLEGLQFKKYFNKFF